MLPLDVRDRALEAGIVGALPAAPGRVLNVHLLVMPMQQGMLSGGGQLGPGRVDAEPDGIAQRFDQPHEVVADVPAAPRPDRALGQGPVRIRDHQLGVDLHPGAQAGAVRTGAPGGVERERPRLELVERQVVVEAGQVLGEHPLAVRVVLGQVDEVEHHHPAGQGQSGLHRVGQPPPGRLLHVQPVDHDLDVVLLVLLQRRPLARGTDAVQPDHDAVDPGPGVALGLQVAEQLAVLALAPAHHRGQHLEPGALVQLQHPVDDLLRALPRDRSAADRAVRLAHPGVQQPQVVVNLGDRADRGARVASRGLLVDGDRRRQPVDEVDVRLVHLAEELPGVGRQRLDVPALALGEDRVKGQARLPGPGQPGEHDQRITRQVERDVLEVVLARAADHKTISHSVQHSNRDVAPLKAHCRDAGNGVAAHLRYRPHGSDSATPCSTHQPAQPRRAPDSLDKKQAKAGCRLDKNKSRAPQIPPAGSRGRDLCRAKLARSHTSAGKGRGHRQSQDRTASIITKAMITAPPDTPEPAAIRPARGQDHSHPSDHSGPASGSKRLTRDTSWWGRRQLQLRGGLAGAPGLGAAGWFLSCRIGRG